VRSVVPILERTLETPSTVTLRFEVPWTAEPGQFVMVWVPGDDELPMSLSYPGPLAGVTIKTMGSTSRHIRGLEVGTPLGIRGPYGNRFDLSLRRLLIVAGGSGAAVLAPGAETVLQRGGTVSVALGATTAPELLFAERFRAMGAELRVSTDDGSQGAKGYVTPLAEAWMDERRFDAVWTCGPEVMMRKVLDAARRRGVPAFGSVERVMKCALGLCDACALGPYHVCVDGPVFPGETLGALGEFGRTKRDFCGRRVPA
jgi:dihydroorotate dehydrogenase electron transfer subunit